MEQKAREKLGFELDKNVKQIGKCNPKSCFELMVIELTWVNDLIELENDQTIGQV